MPPKSKAAACVSAGACLITTAASAHLPDAASFGVSQLGLQICRSFAVSIGILQPKLGTYRIRASTKSRSYSPMNPRIRATPSSPSRYASGCS
jgi:hypothetical protein